MPTSGHSRAVVVRRRVASGLGAFLVLAALPTAGAQALADHREVAVAGTEVQASVRSVVDPVQGYIQRVYADLFNRTPDPSGLATWTAALSTGTPRVAVANAITSSTEYRSGLITGSYQHYLSRGPDPAGLSSWLATMSSGRTISQMESGFIASDEYYSKAGSTPDGWVVKLYADVLGRTAGPSEVAFWTGQLAGGASRSQVAMGFLLSTERLSTVVNGYYQHLLGRGLDPSGQHTWVGILQAGGRNEAIIGGIIASDEYWSLAPSSRLARIEVAPARSTIADGSTQTYTVTGFDQFGASLGVVTDHAVLAVGGNPGLCDGPVCHSATTGDAAVTATVDGLIGSAVLTMRAPAPVRYTAYAWGANDFGTFGDGTTTSRNSPVVAAQGGTRWESIDVSVHALAVRSDGSLWGWGFNYYHQLGLGAGIEPVLVPTQIGTGATWRQVSAGSRYSLAVQDDGTLWGWGANQSGSLMTEEMELIVPTRLGSDADWVQVCAEDGQAAGIKRDGTLWTWGAGEYGSLGVGENVFNQHRPVRVGTATDWTLVSCGRNHVAALREDGTLWTWGTNGWGQLGDGTQVDRSLPFRVGSAGTRWLDVDAGVTSTYAVRSDHTLWAWGEHVGPPDVTGTLGASAVPIQLGAGTQWQSVSGGLVGFVALDTAGGLWAGGANARGEVGDGTTEPRAQPVRIGTEVWTVAETGDAISVALRP